jgi:hypothetical protein
MLSLEISIYSGKTLVYFRIYEKESPVKDIIQDIPPEIKEKNIHSSHIYKSRREW